jgi:transposase
MSEVEEVGEVKIAPQKYELKNGTMGSRSAHIRELYVEDGMSRGEIAEMLGISYNVVHAATANLDNGTTGTVGARIMVKNDKGDEVARVDYIKELAEGGMDRGAIAKKLGIAYGIVYAATKSMEGVAASGHGGKVMIEVNGEKVPRADYIREQFALGRNRREIATEVGCDYAVVWSATKPAKVEGAEGAEGAEDAEDEDTEDENPE